MDYNLESYGNFDNELQALEVEAKKKKILKSQEEWNEHLTDLQFSCLCDCFLRLSWYQKKRFLLSIIKNIKNVNILVRFIGYLGPLYGKMACYSQVSANCKRPSEQIVVDHNRSLEWDCLKSTLCVHFQWLTSLPPYRQILLILALLQLAGGSMVRKIYLPVINHCNKQLMAEETANRMGHNTEVESVERVILVNEDNVKYPKDHPCTVEVEKLKKKWDDLIKKYRQDIIGEGQSTKVNKKTKKTKSKASSEHMDYFQTLPIWIVKKILNFLDIKSLHNMKKVGKYWANACNDLIKDRRMRTTLNKLILINDIDIPEISDGSKALTSRQRRLHGLMNRGAVLNELRPKVKKSLQTRTCLLTSIDKTEEICRYIDKFLVFPRLIREDVLLYKPYPCLLKDLNVILDVENDLMNQQATLSYSLSQKLSDTFSISAANLSDW
ncbi:hypothetical protein ABEB36_006720 [Hypothenemus hampei]|uniref:F-box domain-containing protein n=1 Tax=Hypothenemus hampei TaxID=57062 RepID=A0ABD1EVG2_HYPHA